MMKIIIETERLFLREIALQDQEDIYEMDSDPQVHLYIENRPVTSMDEVKCAIEMIQKQYQENGIARWAVIDKLTNECIGWSGLKYYKEVVNNHQYFFELGYRFKQKHWGKGFATESSKAILEYGFKHFEMEKIVAITDPKNSNSQKVLNKLGFEFIQCIGIDGEPIDWFELSRKTWMQKDC